MKYFKPTSTENTAPLRYDTSPEERSGVAIGGSAEGKFFTVPKNHVPTVTVPVLDPMPALYRPQKSDDASTPVCMTETYYFARVAHAPDTSGEKFYHLDVWVHEDLMASDGKPDHIALMEHLLTRVEDFAEFERRMGKRSK